MLVEWLLDPFSRFLSARVRDPVCPHSFSFFSIIRFTTMRLTVVMHHFHELRNHGGASPEAAESPRIRWKRLSQFSGMQAAGWNADFLFLSDFLRDRMQTCMSQTFVLTAAFYVQWWCWRAMSLPADQRNFSPNIPSTALP